MGRPIGRSSSAAGCTSTSRSSPVDGGPNAFDDPHDEYGLSSLARQCLGGLIAHHEALAAMSAPLVNSYRRLDPGHHRRLLGELGPRQPDQHVPRARASAARRRASRTACRAAAPTRTSPPRRCSTPRCSAWSTGSTAATPQVGDGDAEPNTDRHTPHTLGEAIAAFEADTVLCEAMGADLVQAFLDLAPRRIGQVGGGRRHVGRRSHLGVGARAVPPFTHGLLTLGSRAIRSWPGGSRPAAGSSRDSPSSPRWCTAGSEALSRAVTSATCSNAAPTPRPCASGSTATLST